MRRLPPLHLVNIVLLGFHTTWTILYIAVIVFISADSSYKQEKANFLAEQCIVYAKFCVYIVLFSLVVLVKYIYVSRIYLTLASVYFMDFVVSICILLAYFARYDDEEKSGKYRTENVLFVSITNGLVILLDLIMLPMLRCFHRQDEYRKNIGLPPLSTIKRRRVSEVDDATLKNPFSTAPSLFSRNSIMYGTEPKENDNDQIKLSSTINITDNSNNNNNDTSNVTNEINIRTGKVHSTKNQNNTRVPSGRTNSITFHGYGLDNNPGANSTSVVSINSNESILLEDQETTTGGGHTSSDNNGSSFLIKAIKQNMTRSRKDSKESNESWSSSDESDNDDIIATANFSSNSSFSKEQNCIKTTNSEAIKPTSVRPTRQNTVITRPTHPPPKPPAAPTKSICSSSEALHEIDIHESSIIVEGSSHDSTERTVGEKTPNLTDSSKKKVAPLKPQRPSLLRLKNMTSDDDITEQNSRKKSPPSHSPPPPPMLESPLDSAKIDMINFGRSETETNIASKEPKISQKRQ